MSEYLESLAWECTPVDISTRAQSKPSMKLFLVALAREADEDGIARPSDRVLLQRTGLRPNGMKNVKRALADANWFDRVPGLGQGNYTTYILDVEKMEQAASAAQNNLTSA